MEGTTALDWRYSQRDMARSVVTLDFSFRCIHDDEIPGILEILKYYPETDLVDISGNCLTQSGLNHFIEGLKSSYVTCVYMGNNKISDETILKMKENKPLVGRIEELSLKTANFTEKSLLYLSVIIKKASFLSFLDLSSSNITVEGSKILAEGLNENKTLIDLVLNRNKDIGPVGAKHISYGVQKSKIKNLFLCHCEILCDGLIEFKRCDKLTKLSVMSNKIKNRGLVEYSKSIPKNIFLKNLVLGFNLIEKEGINFLCQKVKKNFSIRELNISYNLFFERSPEGFLLMNLVGQSITEIPFYNPYFIKKIGYKTHLIVEFKKCLSRITPRLPFEMGNHILSFLKVIPV